MKQQIILFLIGIGLSSISAKFNCPRKLLRLTPYSEFTFCDAYFFISDIFEGNPGSATPYIRKYFDRFDNNLDGFIDNSEAADMHRKVLAYIKRKSIKARIKVEPAKTHQIIFNILDINKDRKLSMNEITAHLEQDPRYHQHGIIPWIILSGFYYIDNNRRDGLLNWDEIAKVVCNVNDGTESYEYCFVVRSQIAARRRRRKPKANRLRIGPPPPPNFASARRTAAGVLPNPRLPSLRKPIIG